MTGTVDELGRALLRITLRHPVAETESRLDAWIDTGFTGDLVVPRSQLRSMNLPLGPTARAVLADGSEIGLETFTCLLQWFGEWRRIEVIANEGQYPLLGVTLLQGHALHIDYRTGTISVD